MQKTIWGIDRSGSLIILDDYTRWEIDPPDSFTSRRWKTMDKVSVLSNTMTHCQSNETVSVRPAAHLTGPTG